MSVRRTGRRLGFLLAVLAVCAACGTSGPTHEQNDGRCCWLSTHGCAATFERLDPHTVIDGPIVTAAGVSF